MRDAAAQRAHDVQLLVGKLRCSPGEAERLVDEAHADALVDEAFHPRPEPKMRWVWSPGSPRDWLWTGAFIFVAACILSAALTWTHVK